MIISVSEFFLSAYVKGAFDIKGFEEEQSPDDLKRNVSSERLISAGMLEPFDAESESSGFYRFSALGEMILKTVSEPDVWLRIEDKNSKKIRRIYIKGEYYLYIDEAGEMLRINFIPLLPLVFGACADIILDRIEKGRSEKETTLMKIYGESGERGIDITLYSNEEMDLNGNRERFNRKKLMDHLIEAVTGGLKYVETTE